MGSVRTLPEVAFSIGPDNARPDGLLELMLWTAPATASQRQAVVLLVDFASGAELRWRTPANTTPDIDDPAQAALGLVRAYLAPLAGELVLMIDEVRALLEAPIVAPETGQPTPRKLGEVLHPDVLVRTTTGGVRYRLSLLDAAVDGSFDPLLLLRRVLQTAANAAIEVINTRTDGGLAISEDVPLTVRLAKLDETGGTRYGVGITIPADKQLELFSSSDVRLSLEVHDDWLSDAAIQPPVTGGPGLELFLVRIPTTGTPSIAPRMVIKGLGLRIDKPEGAKLIDLAVTLRSIGLHAYVDKDFDSAGHARRRPPRARPARAAPRERERQPGRAELPLAEQGRRRLGAARAGLQPEHRAWCRNPAAASTSRSAPGLATGRGGYRSNAPSGRSTSSRSGSASVTRRTATSRTCRSWSTVERPSPA